MTEYVPDGSSQNPENRTNETKGGPQDAGRKSGKTSE